VSRLPFNRTQTTREHDTQTRFLLLWPWPWPDDLYIYELYFLSYSEDVPAQRT